VSLEPKVVLQDVSLGNAPWGKSPQMITAKRVEVPMALLPLLYRDFQARTLALADLPAAGNPFRKSDPSTEILCA
jgi:uncharacterized protein involved in outer membrane biogenesis